MTIEDYIEERSHELVERAIKRDYNFKEYPYLLENIIAGAMNDVQKIIYERITKAMSLK